MLNQRQPEVSGICTDTYCMRDLAHDVDGYWAANHLRNPIQAPIPLTWKYLKVNTRNPYIPYTYRSPYRP